MRRRASRTLRTQAAETQPDHGLSGLPHGTRFSYTMLDFLQRLPLDHFQRAKAWLRHRYATVSWKDSAPHVEVPNDPAVVEETLREAHFEDASGWSLRYRGEILNLRRPAGRRPDGTPVEDHIRFRECPDNPSCLEGIAHREPNRWEEKSKHVHEDGLEWLSSGHLQMLLDDAGLPGDLIFIPVDETENGDTDADDNPVQK